MGKRDPRIDAYIAKSAEYSRPIMKRVREIVHEGCPEVVETLKWSCPSFEYKGILCGMAAFKQHCVFGFWKHEQVVGKLGKSTQAMGSFGCLKELSDLPSKAVLLRCIKKAVQLNDDGIKAVRTKTRPKKPVAMHPKFKAALAKKKKALANLEAFSPSQQRDYLEWIAEAKAEETRDRRIAQAVEWLADNKPRHWKYMNC